MRSQINFDETHSPTVGCLCQEDNSWQTSRGIADQERSQFEGVLTDARVRPQAVPQFCQLLTILRSSPSYNEMLHSEIISAFS